MGVSLVTLGVPGLVGGGAAAPYDPLTDTDLIYLHDLDTALTALGGSTPANGANVGYVPDSAPAGTYNVTQIAAGRGGTYRTNAANGHAAVEFVPANLDRLDFGTTVTTEAITLFYVIARTAATNDTVLAHLQKHGITMRIATTGVLGGYWGAQANSTFIVNDTFDIITIVVRNFNDVDIRQNGSSQTITTGTAYNNLIKSCYGAASASNKWCPVKLAYAFALAGAADASKVTAAESFLATRFGVTLSF